METSLRRLAYTAMALVAAGIVVDAIDSWWGSNAMPEVTPLMAGLAGAALTAITAYSRRRNGNGNGG